MLQGNNGDAFDDAAQSQPGIFRTIDGTGPARWMEAPVGARTPRSTGASGTGAWHARASRVGLSMADGDRLLWNASINPFFDDLVFKFYLGRAQLGERR